MTTYEWFSGLLDAIGSQPIGGKVRQCPAHRDRHPSLSVRPGPDDTLRVKCFSGCDTDAILAAVSCARSRLAKAPPVNPATYAGMVGIKVTFPPVLLREGHPSGRGYRLEAVHDYGAAVLERWRSGQHKELIWETVRPDGGRVPGLIGVQLSDLPLYREREVRQAVALGEPVLLVESESSVDALRGWHSTTWAGGGDAINLGRIADVLGGHPVVVAIPDNDPVGRRWYARTAAAGLVSAVLWPDDGQDSRDLYGQLGIHRFERAVRDALPGRVEQAA